MPRTLFHKIRDGEAPSHTVYEDEEVLAFLDIDPATKGHTVIIPKESYENLHDTPVSVFSALIEVAKKLSSRYVDALGADGFNIIQSTGGSAEQEIQYVHVHLIPRYEGGDFKVWHHRPEDTDLELVADSISDD
jgi:histidine triad (HIT) family protein